MIRLRLAALALASLVFAGCVEGEVVYTVNPDGSAKVKFDIVTVKQPAITPGPVPKQGPEKTLEDHLRDTLRPLFQSQGVSAWKDVSAEFLPNGKLKISATAYVRRLAEFKPNGLSLLQPMYQVTKAGDGSLRLAPGPGGLAEDNRKFKTPEEIKKFSDEELDKYVQLQMIEAQGVRPIMLALFSQANLKVTYELPGDAKASAGFKVDGKKVTHTLEGDKVVASLDKWLAKDRAAWRKAYREAKSGDPLRLLNLEGLPPADTSATVAKPGEAQFDFDKEVKEAREAYPALRKKFGFGDDVFLPTSDPPPLKKP